MTQKSFSSKTPNGNGKKVSYAPALTSPSSDAALKPRFACCYGHLPTATKVEYDPKDFNLTRTCERVIFQSPNSESMVYRPSNHCLVMTEASTNAYCLKLAISAHNLQQGGKVRNLKPSSFSPKLLPLPCGLGTCQHGELARVLYPTPPSGVDNSSLIPAVQHPHMQMDRFIPSRSAIDLDLANLHLTKENGAVGLEAGAASASPSKDEYKKMLADSMGVDSSGRVLAFKQKVCSNLALKRHWGCTYFLVYMQWPACWYTHLCCCNLEILDIIIGTHRALHVHWRVCAGTSAA